jgi:hypothetical protein
MTKETKTSWALKNHELMRIGFFEELSGEEKELMCFLSLQILNKVQVAEEKPEFS